MTRERTTRHLCRERKWRLAVLLLLLLPALARASGDSTAAVIGSKHNLSAGGPGPVTSGRQDACIFCHTPHSSDVNVKPLWNHDLSTQTYSTYTSSTYNAGAGAPAAGSSKQCLSCHDGTVALGATVSEGLISTTGSMGTAAVLGTALTNDHPIAIQPVDDGQLNLNLFQSPPSTGDPNVVLVQGKIECSTCHSPHEPARDEVVRKFLVRSNSNGTLCLACHDTTRAQPNALNGWVSGAHATATNTVPTTSSFAAYGTVNSNACGNCHLPHNVGAASASRLLRASEESACSPCHSGANVTPALRNVLSEFAKFYAHPTTTVAGLHDAAENAFPLNASRHAECADCHNSHAASGTGGAASPPAVPAPLLGASGYDGGSPLRPASNEYQVCYKCHADSANKPQTTPGYSTYGRTPQRQTYSSVADPHNKRLEFASTISRHNVSSARGGSGSNNTVPSVRPAIRYPNGSTGRSLAAGTYIYCTDCHNSNSALRFGGLGANGPHGSTNEHLLVRPHPMNTPPSVPGNVMGEVTWVSGAATYPLCNMCHYIDGGENTDAIMNDRTFRHDTHIRGGGTSCANCHDPHGIHGGNTTNNPSLVNWDLTTVGRNTANEGPRLDRSGVYRGRCYLRCHDKDHRGRGY